MGKIQVVSPKGDEEFEFGTTEEAREIIERFRLGGGKYWILDKETKKLLADTVGIKETQTIVLISVVGGG
jgi:hypothetical protein